MCLVNSSKVIDPSTVVKQIGLSKNEECIEKFTWVTALDCTSLSIAFSHIAMLCFIWVRTSTICATMDKNPCSKRYTTYGAIIYLLREFFRTEVSRGHNIRVERASKSKLWHNIKESISEHWRLLIFISIPIKGVIVTPALQSAMTISCFGEPVYAARRWRRSVTHESRVPLSACVGSTRVDSV